MKTKFMEFSLVVLAKDHNPTILNPDFLLRNLIIKDEFEWQAIGQPITTPLISTVQYDSKVVITVEPMKLQITDASGSDVNKSHICEILSNYVSKLPHVKYSALGINFSKITIVDNVTDYLIDRFLKNGGWNQDANQMQSAAFKFVYELKGGSLSFSIDKGVQREDKKPFVLSRGNFHRDLDTSKMPTNEQIKNYLGYICNDWEKFQQLHAIIIENQV